jgi:hypothetical protein
MEYNTPSCQLISCKTTTCLVSARTLHPNVYATQSVHRPCASLPAAFVTSYKPQKKQREKEQAQAEERKIPKS